jgi:hypothetical protein
MLGWAAGPAGGQAPAALRGARYGPLPPSGWPDKVPPADLIPCGGIWYGMGLWCVALFGCGGGSILGKRATKGPVVVLRVYSIQYFQHKFYLFSYNYVLSDKSRIFFCETQNIYHSFTCLVT